MRGREGKDMVSRWRRGRNWIGEQMRSTIAKPDVLRLLIPDMADSIIHRFANSSNIRAGAAIAASQPPSAWHSTYTTTYVLYYRFHVGVRAAHAHTFTQTGARIRAQPREWSRYTHLHVAVHIQKRVHVKPSSGGRSSWTRLRLTFQLTM